MELISRPPYPISIGRKATRNKTEIPNFLKKLLKRRKVC